MIPLAVQPIVQLGSASCAVAALAMYLNQPYRDVSEAAMRIAPTVHQAGLWGTQMLTVAKAFDVALVSRKAPVPNISERSGILCVMRKPLRHAAVLFQGVVIDPLDGQVWDLEAWMATKRWRVTALLEAN